MYISNKCPSISLLIVYRSQHFTVAEHIEIWQQFEEASHKTVQKVNKIFTELNIMAQKLLIHLYSLQLVSKVICCKANNNP